MTMYDDFKIWKEEEDSFDGDLRLYWAGKMADVVDALYNARPVNISDIIYLLDSCKNEYNELIFGNYNPK